MAEDRSRMMTCMFRDRDSAERGYASLVNRGYTKDDVNLLMSEECRNRHFSKAAGQTELGSKASEGAAVGAVAGGGLGALLIGLAAAGFAVPGVPIIAMGPLVAALTGAGSGGAVGALVGALIGSGIPEDRAKLYEQGIKDGGIVLGVVPLTDEDADYFEREWRDARGEQIYRPASETRRVA
jgi:hypothetical protein